MSFSSFLSSPSFFLGSGLALATVLVVLTAPALAAGLTPALAAGLTPAFGTFLTPPVLVPGWTTPALALAASKSF